MPLPLPVKKDDVPCPLCGAIICIESEISMPGHIWAYHLETYECVCGATMPTVFDFARHVEAIGGINALLDHLAMAALQQIGGDALGLTG